MNLQYLSEIQAGLVEHIEENHPRQEGEDRLAKKILALQVELGELANELPEVFKFWSNKKNNYEKALKEYVDCLHFILDIGLELGMEEVCEELELKPHCHDKITTQFIDLISDVSSIFFDYHDEDLGDYLFEMVVRKFLGLGEMLGFTWEQIEQAYLEKNKVNHERQVNGY